MTQGIYELMNGYLNKRTNERMDDGDNDNDDDDDLF